VQTTQSVWDALKQLPDPELPVLSIVELGIVRSVELRGLVCDVVISPTLVGCPALRTISQAVTTAIEQLGLEPRVTVSFARRDWTLTHEAIEKLRQAGIALAESGGCRAPGLVQLRLARVACPYCGCPHTRLLNAFAATPCRAVRHCDGCQQPFEQFKLPLQRPSQPTLEPSSGRTP
jgi:ring-1,2-phenylacetyl-CoA epoxidase subunit PaaD